MPQYKDGKKFVRKKGTYIGNAKRRAEVKSMSKGPLKKPTSIKSSSIKSPSTKPASIKTTSIKLPLRKPDSVRNFNNQISGSKGITNLKNSGVNKAVLGVPLKTSITAGKKIVTDFKSTVNSGRSLLGAITEESNVKRMKGDLTKAKGKSLSLLNYISGIADAKINKPKNKYEERKNRPVVSSEEYKTKYNKGLNSLSKNKNIEKGDRITPLTLLLSAGQGVVNLITGTKGKSQLQKNIQKTYNTHKFGYIKKK